MYIPVAPSEVVAGREITVQSFDGPLKIRLRRDMLRDRLFSRGVVSHEGVAAGETLRCF
jgi:hypothetical protein